MMKFYSVKQVCNSVVITLRDKKCNDTVSRVFVKYEISPSILLRQSCFLKIESNVYLVGAERVCTYGHPKKRFIIRLFHVKSVSFSH